MRVFGAATGMGPVAALLCFFSIGAATALAYIPGRDAPVTVETICNPKPDAADILLPLPCDLTLALRAVDTPGGGTYFIGKYEISRYQWDAVMTGKCEALSTGPGALPLREVTPSEIRGFLDRYNAWLTRERKSRPAAFSERVREAGEARLPTEAEWEFAARGGLAVPEAERTRDIPPEKLREFGVISDPIPIHEPERIGMRLPNALGIYDMVGNVKEMVASASDSLIAFRGGSYKHNPGEIDIGRHDEITAINERGAERAVSDLGLRLAFSAPGYSGDPAAAPEPAGGGVNLPLALALSAAAFAAGGILVGLVVWFYQRRRLGMPVEEELALQENLTKWQRGYKQIRAAGLAVKQRADEKTSALAHTLKAAAESEEARRAAEARAVAAEKRAEEAAAHNQTITRAAEEQIRRARAELEELRKRAEAEEERARAAEKHAEEAATALREQLESVEATDKQAAERAEAALAQAQTELEELCKTADAAEQARQAAEQRATAAEKHAEETVAALQEQLERAGATHKQATEQTEAALAQVQTELEELRKTADAAEQARKQAVAELERLRETLKQENVPPPRTELESKPETAQPPFRPVSKTGLPDSTTTPQPERPLPNPAELIEAAEIGDVKQVATLLANGAVVNAKRENGVTALMEAAGRGYVDCARLLLEAGADVNAKDGGPLGRTALLWAAYKGHAECLRLLLSAGAEVNAKDKSGWTALMLALDHPDCARLLLKAGAEVNARGKDDKTALMVAMGSDVECVRLLIKAGADLNAKDADGKTALMWAAYWAERVGDRGDICVDCARLLIDAGADLNAKDKNGKTALKWAWGHEKMTALLRGAGARE